MVLKFCEKCKTLMSPTKQNNKILLKCSNCGFEDIENSLSAREKIRKKEFRGRGFNESENKFATYNHICKKCGYNKAQVLDLGIFVSDEDNLILLKCGKCGFSERIGKRTS